MSRVTKTPFIPAIPAILAAAAMASPALASPPIFQPGAPGGETRRITPEESYALGQTSYIEADARFMQHMIVHHNQAVEMGALVEGRTTHPGITLIAERIALSQEAEMAMMRTWLIRRGEPVEASDLHGDHSGHGEMDHGDMDHAQMDHGEMDHGEMDHDQMNQGEMDHAAMDPMDVAPMPGMLTPRQMQALAAAEGEEFDRLYLEGMILHHQGAIDMVESLMAAPGAAQDPELYRFVGDVVADQTAEIGRMRLMLDDLS